MMKTIRLAINGSRGRAVSKIRPSFSVLAICSLAALTLPIWGFQASIAVAPVVQKRQLKQSPKIAAKNYLKMTEEEQKEFIADEADGISYALGNSAGMSAKDKITPEAVAAIKPFVDAYAKRRSVANKRSGCDFGRERLSAVLGRWWRNQSVITRVFDAERGLEKPVSDQQWQWLYPKIGTYLAMVESEFCPCMQGANGKLGFFQLTPENAAKYGLKVRPGNSSRGVDERCNITKAAMAAARDLKSLAGDKNNPLRTLIALARYHRGAEVSLPTDDPFWVFVARKEYRVANSAQPNSAETASVETQAFEFIRQFFAAGILIEHPEFFDNSLPPQASGEARMEKIRQEMNSEILKGIKFIVVSRFVNQPQTKLDDWLKTEPESAELIDCILYRRSGSNKQLLNSNPALKKAPDWLKNLVSNLSRVRELSTSIASHQYHGQTVHYLKSNILSVLYDNNGKIICMFNLVDEKGDSAEKCPDFKTNRKDGKLLWESERKKRMRNRIGRLLRREDAEEFIAS
ncbi:MAG TPA: transglycosylase SLT domain-containing protein [Blastocatellia bacterium]|nr:transglycosylase SLT domain-containing protein [Blastocatellia bacterium]